MNVLLAQTDTTVGFLSQDAAALERVKGRPEGKPFLKVFADFHSLKETLRTPIFHRRRIRHARKTTFIVKNQAFRYVGGTDHARLVSSHGWLYSTSANPSGGSFERAYCCERADWIVEDALGFQELTSSSIYRLGQRRLRRLR